MAEGESAEQNERSNGSFCKMNLAIEFYVADAVTAYLTAKLDAETIATCPAVSFGDPMALDDAHRIVTFCPQAVNDPAQPGTFSVEVQTMVKSLWSEPTYADDLAAHFGRVNQCRNALMAADLGAAVAAYADGDKLAIYAANRGVTFTTGINEQWITSEVNFQIKCYLPEWGN